MRILIGFVLVAATFLASIITIFAACRPFHRYWQLKPDPGSQSPPPPPWALRPRARLTRPADSCEPAISRPVIWVSFAANVSTDMYLLSIPLPMLWRSSLSTPRKMASTVILGAGFFVLICAVLKSVFVLVVSPRRPARSAAAR